MSGAPTFGVRDLLLRSCGGAGSGPFSQFHRSSPTLTTRPPDHTNHSLQQGRVYRFRYSPSPLRCFRIKQASEWSLCDAAELVCWRAQNNKSSDPARIWTCHWPGPVFLGVTTSLHLGAPYIPTNNATQHQVFGCIASQCPSWNLNSQDMTWHTQGTTWCLQSN